MGKGTPRQKALAEKRPSLRFPKGFKPGKQPAYEVRDLLRQMNSYPSPSRVINKVNQAHRLSESEQWAMRTPPSSSKHAEANSVSSESSKCCEVTISHPGASASKGDGVQLQNVTAVPRCGPVTTRTHQSLWL